MAEHGISMSLSHTSDDSSSDQLTPAATQGSGGGVGSRRLPPSSSAGHHPYQQLAQPPPPKKPRGRPPGSKNKPKPPVVITQDSDQALQPVVIEVAAGADVVDAVVSFARRRHVGISVLSGSGTIANVTLRHPYSHAPALTLHGPFTMLSFTGSYVTGPFTPPRPPLASSSSSSAAIPTHPTCSNFAVSFSGSQGQIFGGVVAGNLVAASAVVVVASVFKKPEFHRVGFNGSGGEGGGGGGGGGGRGDGGGDDDDDDDGDQHHHNPSAGGGGDHHQGGAGSDNTLSVFNVATTPSTMNCHPGDVNAMQWGHTLSSSRPASY